MRNMAYMHINLHYFLGLGISITFYLNITKTFAASTAHNDEYDAIYRTHIANTEVKISEII